MAHAAPGDMGEGEATAEQERAGLGEAAAAACADVEGNAHTAAELEGGLPPQADSRGRLTSVGDIEVPETAALMDDKQVVCPWDSRPASVNGSRGLSPTGAHAHRGAVGWSRGGRLWAAPLCLFAVALALRSLSRYAATCWYLSALHHPGEASAAAADPDPAAVAAAAATAMATDVPRRLRAGGVDMYDCEVGLQQWTTLWAEDRQAWCCGKWAAAGFAGVDGAQERCCAGHGVGCAGEELPDEPAAVNSSAQPGLDAAASEAPLAAISSTIQLDTILNGSEAALAAAANRTDCQTDMQDMEYRWPQDKQMECCKTWKAAGLLPSPENHSLGAWPSDGQVAMVCCRLLEEPCILPPRAEVVVNASASNDSSWNYLQAPAVVPTCALVALFCAAWLTGECAVWGKSCLCCSLAALLEGALILAAPVVHVTRGSTRCRGRRDVFEAMLREDATLPSLEFLLAEVVASLHPGNEGAYCGIKVMDLHSTVLSACLLGLHEVCWNQSGRLRPLLCNACRVLGALALLGLACCDVALGAVADVKDLPLLLLGSFLGACLYSNAATSLLAETWASYAGHKEPGTAAGLRTLPRQYRLLDHQSAGPLCDGPLERVEEPDSGSVFVPLCCLPLCLAAGRYRLHREPDAFGNQARPKSHEDLAKELLGQAAELDECQEHQRALQIRLAEAERTLNETEARHAADLEEARRRHQEAVEAHASDAELRLQVAADQARARAAELERVAEDHLRRAQEEREARVQAEGQAQAYAQAWAQTLAALGRPPPNSDTPPLLPASPHSDEPSAQDAPVT